MQSVLLEWIKCTKMKSNIKMVTIYHADDMIMMLISAIP